MVTAAFFVICILGTGFLTAFFVALCKDGGRHRKCSDVENLLGADYEMDLDRPHSQQSGRTSRLHPIPIERRKRKSETAETIGTGTFGTAE